MAGEPNIRAEIEDQKEARHRLLRSLLTGGRYSSQSEVARALGERGLACTQASVSRDFRELGVAKVAGAYRIIGASESAPARPKSEGTGVVRSVEAAGANLLVIRTAGGAAGIVAARIDRDATPGILGTIAGDDTVFVATYGKQGQRRARALVAVFNTELAL